MSAFDDMMDDYYLKESHTIDTPEGGYITEWVNGPIVKMWANLGNSNEIRQAMSQNLKMVYTATFPIDTPVQYNKYLEKVGNPSIIFRITSKPEANKTPGMAKYPTCYATAELTELPKQ